MAKNTPEEKDYGAYTPGEQLAILEEAAKRNGWSATGFDGTYVTSSDPHPGYLGFEHDYAISHDFHLSGLFSHGFLRALLGTQKIETNWGSLERWMYHWIILSEIADDAKLAWVFAAHQSLVLDPSEPARIGTVTFLHDVRAAIGKMARQAEATAIVTALKRNGIAQFENDGGYYLTEAAVQVILQAETESHLVDLLADVLGMKTVRARGIRGLSDRRLQLLRDALKTFYTGSS